MNVLWWVRNQSRRFKPFAANRIREIQRLSAPENWNHVRTSENSADLLSREMPIEDLALSDLWWYGLENLRNGNEALVKIDIERSSEFHEGKVIQVVMVANAMQSDTLSLCRLNPKRHSSWK